MREEQLLYSLAFSLGVDVDVVRLWPMSKVNGWTAFFALRDEAAAMAAQVRQGGTNPHRFVRGESGFFHP